MDIYKFVNTIKRVGLQQRFLSLLIKYYAGNLNFFYTLCILHSTYFYIFKL